MWCCTYSFFIGWFRVQSFKKITSLHICSIATMQLFHSPVSWEQSEIPVYLKHIVKAKHRQLFICVWLSKHGSLSVITWKVRAHLNFSIRRNESLCCCRASWGHSWPPSQCRGKGQRRQQWLRARVSPQGSLRSFSLPSAPFFFCGLPVVENFRETSKDFLKLSRCFSMADIFAVGLGQKRCIC